MLAHSGVQNLSPFLELLLVDFAAAKHSGECRQESSQAERRTQHGSGLSAIREALKS
jgi:hypothetical protein